MLHLGLLWRICDPVEGTTLLRMVYGPGAGTSDGYASAQENSGYRVVMKEGIQQSLWNAEIGVELNQSNRQFPTLLDAQSELVKVLGRPKEIYS